MLCKCCTELRELCWFVCVALSCIHSACHENATAPKLFACPQNTHKCVWTRGYVPIDTQILHWFVWVVLTCIHSACHATLLLLKMYELRMPTRISWYGLSCEIVARNTWLQWVALTYTIWFQLHGCWSSNPKWKKWEWKVEVPHLILPTSPKLGVPTYAPHIWQI